MMTDGCYPNDPSALIFMSLGDDQNSRALSQALTTRKSLKNKNVEKFIDLRERKE